MLLLSLLLTLLCVGAFGECMPVTDDSLEEPLNLTPLIENGEAAYARNRSTVDPTLFAGLKSHAAFINVNKTGKWNLFFWFFPADGLPLENTPWIIWLQGGPGASSLYGLFEEIGPLQCVDGKAQKMPITWGSNYSLLFIDNPVKAGYSYVEDGGDENMYNQDQVGECLLNFTQQFLEVFPELRKAPLFIAGESYAGKYIPAFGHYIHNKNDSLPINLKGLAIGNGWIDPPSMQYKADLALYLGLTDHEQSAQMAKYEKLARQYWKEGKINEYVEAVMKTEDLFYKFTGDIETLNIVTDEAPKFDFATCVNRSEVKTALHVGNRLYSRGFSCGRKNGSHYFDDDIFMSVKPWLEELLEHYGVMCYNGQLDWIVAYPLSVHTYRSLKWSGQEKYLNATRNPIYKKDPSNHLSVIGYEKGYGNFVEVLVRSAGHIVPHDQPRAAKQIIDMFIKKFK